MSGQTQRTPESPHGAQVADPPPEPNSGVQVARLFGVPILVEPVWLLLAFVLLSVVVQPSVQDLFSPATSWAVALCFAPLLYLSVLVHELGHSLVAMRFGLRVQRIRLHLLGGVSEIASEAPTAKQEFWIAVAGPLMSLAIFLLSWTAVQVAPRGSIAIVLVAMLAQANLVVAIFNMLPGLPLDGGRVLQAVVWARTGSRYRGVVSAAYAGMVLAGLLILTAPLTYVGGRKWGMISLAWLLIIAVFLWTGALQTLKVARFHKRVGTLWARPLSRRALLVPAQTPIAEAMRRQVISRCSTILVTDAQGQVLGIVSDSAAAATPPERAGEVSVADLMHTVPPQQFLNADTSGLELLHAMNAAPASDYVVTDPGSGEVVGVLRTDDVLRLVNNA